MATAAPIAPLSLEERAIISRVVDAAPPLSPSTLSTLVALLGGAS